MSLICYVCELKVIIFEEEIEEEKPEIYHLENILPLQLSSVSPVFYQKTHTMSNH